MKYASNDLCTNSTSATVPILGRVNRASYRALFGGRQLARSPANRVCKGEGENKRTEQRERILCASPYLRGKPDILGTGLPAWLRANGYGWWWWCRAGGRSDSGAATAAVGKTTRRRGKRGGGGDEARREKEGAAVMGMKRGVGRGTQRGNVLLGEDERTQSCPSRAGRGMRLTRLCVSPPLPAGEEDFASLDARVRVSRLGRDVREWRKERASSPRMSWKVRWFFFPRTPPREHVRTVVRRIVQRRQRRRRPVVGERALVRNIDDAYVKGRRPRCVSLSVYIHIYAYMNVYRWRDEWQIAERIVLYIWESKILPDCLT